MSRALLLVTLLAIAVVSTHAAVFQAQTFLNADCSGAPFSVSNTTAGECKVSGLGSYSTYATDATTQTMFSFNDANCTGTQAYSATQQKVGACKSFGASSMKTVVLDIGTGPAAPYTFPPAGWATSSYCTFSNGTTSPVCAAGGDVSCTPSAYNVGFCVKRAAAGTTNQVGSWASYCGSGSIAGGRVYFSDNNCGAVVQAMVTPVGCNLGSQSSCPSNAQTLPTLPTMGVTQWDNAQCKQNANNAPVVTLWSSSCVDSVQFACSTTNSTQTATRTTYTDATGMGKCTGAAVTTVSQLSDVCVPSADGKTGTVFSCNVNPGGLSAAPAVSASVVAMIFAAILAFVAARSL